MFRLNQVAGALTLTASIVCLSVAPSLAAPAAPAVKVLNRTCPYIDAARVNALLGTKALVGNNKMTAQIALGGGVTEIGCGFVEGKGTKIVSILRTDKPFHGAVAAQQAADPDEAKFAAALKGLGGRAIVEGTGGAVTLTADGTARYLIVSVIFADSKFPSTGRPNPDLAAKVTALAKVLIA